MTEEEWLGSVEVFSIIQTYMKDREAVALQLELADAYRQYFTPDKFVSVSFNPEPPYLNWQPDPFPGSSDAREKGCKCPERQPDQKYHYIFHLNCPVHQLERVETKQ